MADSGADDPDLNAELREKYRELAAKYAALTARSQRSLAERTTLTRLSRWMLSVAPGALAVVRGGEVMVANERFRELASDGVWLRAAGDEGGKKALPLRSLVLSGAAALSRSGALVAEHRLRSRDGERLALLRLEVSTGPLPMVMAFVDDITERSRNEQELQGARESLIQQERLRMLGEAAAAVAHDLGSTLRGLAFRLATLETDARVHERHEAHLRALSEGIEAAAATVRRLHEFARSGSLEVAPVNLAGIIRQAAALFELEKPGNVKLDVQVGDLPGLRGSAAELSHLFLNLLRNAGDAMRRSGGTVFVRAKLTSTTIHVDVRDEGEGVSAQNLPRLFQPFFTTKAAQGTGLGLWLAAGTMRRMGGTIRARPRRPGMTFSLVFPLKNVRLVPADAAGPPAPAGSAAPAPRRPRRGRRSG